MAGNAASAGGIPKQSPWYLESKDIKCPTTAHALGPAGSFGDVHEGTWLSCPVAIKQLYPVYALPGAAANGDSAEKGGASRTAVETKMSSFCTLMTRISSLHHPHLADFYGMTVFPNRSAPALVTERLHRSLLSRRRDLSCPPLSVRDCVTVLLEVSSALAYLHERPQPIVHGSISSSNVLLTASGRCKVTDTALASCLVSFHEDIECASVYIPLGLSPEQRNTCSVDVYALGVLFLETLTARTEFTADTSLPPPKDPKSWETASNSSQGSNSGRQSTARTRFNKNMKLLQGRNELGDTVAFCLQPCRPKITNARKMFAELTKIEDYLQSMSTLNANVGYLASEVCQLRETVTETFDRNTVAGAQLQDLVEDQNTAIFDSIELTKQALRHADITQQDMRGQYSVLNQDFLVRFETIYQALAATHSAVCNRLALQQQALFIAPPPPPMYTADASAVHSRPVRAMLHPHAHRDTQEVRLPWPVMDGGQLPPPPLHEQHPTGRAGIGPNVVPGHDAMGTNGAVAAAVGGGDAPAATHMAGDVRDQPDGWCAEDQRRQPPHSAVLSPSSSDGRSSGEDGLYIEDEWPVDATEVVQATHLPQPYGDKGVLGNDPLHSATDTANHTSQARPTDMQAGAAFATCVDTTEADDSGRAGSPRLVIAASTEPEERQAECQPTGETCDSAGKELGDTQFVQQRNGADAASDWEPNYVNSARSESEVLPSPHSETAHAVGEICACFRDEQESQTDEVRRLFATQREALRLLHEEYTQDMAQLRQELQARPDVGMLRGDDTHTAIEGQRVATPARADSSVDPPHRTNGDATARHNGARRVAARHRALGFGNLVGYVEELVGNVSEMLGIM